MLLRAAREWNDGRPHSALSMLDEAGLAADRAAFTRAMFRHAARRRRAVLPHRYE